MNKSSRSVSISIFILFIFRFNYIISEGSYLVCKDLNPDDLRLDLMVTHESDVVTEMGFPVECMDPTVVSTHPVLCIYPYFHTLNVGSVINMKIENRIPYVDNNPSTPMVDQVTVMITLCVNLRFIILNFRFIYIIGGGAY